MDIDEVVPGHIDDDGRVVSEPATDTPSHGVVDQIAVRSLAAGARVLGLRRADIPGGGSLAAILRYALLAHVRPLSDTPRLYLPQLESIK